jgi:FG-GAP-like repeat/FG-GAP repeat
MKSMIVSLAVAAAAASALFGAAPAGPVEFTPHDIDASFRGGYSVAVADFNKDGKPDVIANSLQVQELAWYENPSWERHVIVGETQQIVNEAMADIDGDGIPEIAFQSSFAMQAANSAGLNWIAKATGDPRQPWKVQKIDEFPTSHHVAWADLDGDGRKELLNAPLIGEKSVAPTYDQDKASVFWYSPKDWKRHTVTTDIPGIIHRVRPVAWDPGKREQFLVASFEGIALYRPSGSGDSLKFEKQLLSPGHVEKAPRLGASDVRVGRSDGKRFLASVEPWHGNEVVVYTDKNGKWERRVIFDKVSSGHEIAVADLNGDGRDDVVANDNGRVTEQRPDATPGVHVFFAPADPATGEWQYRRIETKAAMNGCVTADINGDRRIDIVCTGAGGVIRWFENKGAAGASTAGGKAEGQKGSMAGIHGRKSARFE